ncbi:hypothetical protein JW872_02095 [Candidatus Babeliales bacterium]|nr:hypothetical protein [Candidatus Babeliales bacterium]
MAHENISRGTIIILNGPSCVGKTSTQKALQVIMDEPYIKLGVDGLFDAVLPDSINLEVVPEGSFRPEDIRYVAESVDADGVKLISLHVGPIGRAVISGMHHAIKAYADQGNNVVVDYILYDQEWLKELVSILKDYRVYWIGLTISLDELERREQERGTSPVGHARSHYHTVHGPKRYDLEVDAEAYDAKVRASMIKQFIMHRQPRAFAELAKIYEV